MLTKDKVTHCVMSLFCLVFCWDRRLRSKLWRPNFGISPKLRLTNFCRSPTDARNSILLNICCFICLKALKLFYFFFAVQHKILITKTCTVRHFTFWISRSLRPNRSTLVSVLSSDYPITATQITAQSTASSLISLYFFVYLSMSEKVKWFSLIKT